MVPGEPALKNPVLTRIPNKKDSLFVRIAHGFYFKGHPDANRVRPNNTISALLYAGEGTGLRRCDALNHLGWSTQLSKIDITTLRRVKPYKPSIIYTKNPNDMRRMLNWNEITLIEALMCIPAAEITWQECLDKLSDGVSRSRLPWKRVLPFSFRRDVMLKVTESPKDAASLKTMFAVKGDDLKWRINEACEAANSCEPVPQVA